MLQHPDNMEHDSREKEVIHLALIVDEGSCSAVAPWWKPSLATLAGKGVLKIVAIWAPRENTAKRINQTLCDGKITNLYFGFEPRSPSIRALAQDQSIKGILIDVSGPTHTAILDALFDCPTLHAHIFSSSTPSLSSSVLIQLAQRHGKLAGEPQWTVASSLRAEIAADAIREMLADIGTPLGASLIGGAIANVTHLTSTTPVPSLGDLLVSYVGLMRHIFGEMTAVSATQSPSRNGDTLVGWAVFSQGVHLTLNVSAKMPAHHDTPLLQLSIWGTLGRLSLSYDAAKNHFVVHRFLKHYEHPSLHHSVGTVASFAAWIERILSAEKQRAGAGQVNTLADVCVSEALLSSTGGVVSFKQTTLAQAQSNMVATQATGL